MKSMKQKALDNIKGGIVKNMQDVAVKTGESLIDGRWCIGFVYEPTIPEKLLKNNFKK